MARRVGRAADGGGVRSLHCGRWLWDCAIVANASESLCDNISVSRVYIMAKFGDGVVVEEGKVGLARVGNKKVLPQLTGSTDLSWPAHTPQAGFLRHGRYRDVLRSGNWMKSW